LCLKKNYTIMTCYNFKANLLRQIVLNNKSWKQLTIDKTDKNNSIGLKSIKLLPLNKVPDVKDVWRWCWMFVFEEQITYALKFQLKFQKVFGKPNEGSEVRSKRIITSEWSMKLISCCMKTTANGISVFSLFGHAAEKNLGLFLFSSTLRNIEYFMSVGSCLTWTQSKQTFHTVNVRQFVKFHPTFSTIYNLQILSISISLTSHSPETCYAPKISGSILTIISLFKVF